MSYMKLVRGSPRGSVWSSLVSPNNARYSPGHVTAAKCNRHVAPSLDCECGIYAVRASWRGLLRFARYGWYPGAEHLSIVAVQPIGRAYSDGLVVRAERVLTLGVLDWRTLLPRSVHRAPEGVAIVFDLLYLARSRDWDTLTLARLRHALGHGCYSADRIRRIVEIYRDRTRWTQCPYCRQDTHTVSRSYYGMMWGSHGTVVTASGRACAQVYVFASRASRDHWVRDGAETRIGLPGYRWPASRFEARRSLGWDARGPYSAECGLCGRVFTDDCELSRHACADKTGAQR